jgi:hypothetical protein
MPAKRSAVMIPRCLEVIVMCPRSHRIFHNEFKSTTTQHNIITNIPQRNNMSRNHNTQHATILQRHKTMTCRDMQLVSFDNEWKGYVYALHVVNILVGSTSK